MKLQEVADDTIRTRGRIEIKDFFASKAWENLGHLNIHIVPPKPAPLKPPPPPARIFNPREPARGRHPTADGRPRRPAEPCPPGRAGCRTYSRPGSDTGYFVHRHRGTAADPIIYCFEKNFIMFDTPEALQS